MATRTETIRYDDFDASTDGVTGHEFALDNIRWEIDLSEENLARLGEALRPFIAAGRRLPAARTRTTARTRTDNNPFGTKAVRRWWQDNRNRSDLPDFRANGPIPQEVYEAHRDAQSAAAP